MKKNSQPMLDTDKQTKPMDGEVSPENARAKAVIFSAKEKAVVKNAKLKK